eukprot:Gb_17216 [translate_table: standard]
MRLNATTKSSIANHFGESISRAMTIQAFKVEDQLMKKTLDLLDKNVSPFFHSFIVNEWLIQHLELLSAIVLSSYVIAMVVLPTGTFNLGFIGMAISYERIKPYMHIPSEAPTIIEDSQPPTEWPSHGEVELQNLKVRAKSLSCINQGGYKMNPFPLADLAELLMMEDPDIENFCTLCGLLTSTDDRGIKFLMVKQVNFILPQKGFP